MSSKEEDETNTNVFGRAKTLEQIEAECAANEAASQATDAFTSEGFVVTRKNAMPPPTHRVFLNADGDWTRIRAEAYIFLTQQDALAKKKPRSIVMHIGEVEAAEGAVAPVETPASTKVETPSETDAVVELLRGRVSVLESALVNATADFTKLEGALKSAEERVEELVEVEPLATAFAMWASVRFDADKLTDDQLAFIKGACTIIGVEL